MDDFSLKKKRIPLPIKSLIVNPLFQFWDSELATLAQVLADQCMGLKEDECRATGKEPITLI